jgi:RNA polymerase sigma factor (sigma-70 family)
MPSAPSAGSPSTSTSGHLLAQARLRDLTALGRLVSRCLPDLTRWAHRRLPFWARTAADTTDFVQDAVVRTLGQRETLDLPSRQALAAYLREAVRNRIRDEHRQFARRSARDAAGSALVQPAPSPLDELLADERHARYRAALARLRPRDRELIVAHVELDYTHEQLGCMTGRSRNAARMALERAIRRLTEQMRSG